MEYLFNFHDTLSVVLGNWWLMLLSLALGIWVGWEKCSWQPRTSAGDEQ